MALVLQLTAMANGSEAIGRHPQDGRAIFVPFAIPGETVRVELTEEKSSFARAQLLEVVSPSPDRVSPACRHFGACGGCHWQHISYPAQLRWKQQIVIDQLARIGGVASPTVLETIPSPDPLHYRNHVQFSQTVEGKLGFIAADGKTILPISECHTARPEIMALFNQLETDKLDAERIGVRVGTEGDALLVFESETGEPPGVELDLPMSVATINHSGEAFPLIGGDALTQTAHGRAFRVSAGSFFQVNTAAAERLVRLILDSLALRGGETVLDLYCGVGLFSAFVAPLAGRVIGVESFAPAVRDAEVNLDEFNNVELYESPVELALAHIADSLSRTPTSPYVILDPPRAGCDKAVTAALLRLAAPRIVYASCDPATLARDARRLIAGGYHLVAAQPLDMFPQTHHIEIVAIFER